MQGRTLRCKVVLDLMDAWEAGQAYVGCSRVTSFDHLRFKNWDPTADASVLNSSVFMGPRGGR